MMRTACRAVGIIGARAYGVKEVRPLATGCYNLGGRLAGDEKSAPPGQGHEGAGGQWQISADIVEQGQLAYLAEGELGGAHGRILLGEGRDHLVHVGLRDLGPRLLVQGA